MAERHTRLLFPFPTSTKFRVYPLDVSPSAYLPQSSSLLSYSAISLVSASTSTPSLVKPDVGPRVAVSESTRSSKALEGRGAGLVVSAAEVVEEVVFGEEAGEGVGERDVVGGEASLEVVLERGGLSWRVRPGAIVCCRASVFLGIEVSC